MVGIFLELGLPSAQLTEATTAISRANGLQALTTEMVAFSNTIDLLAGMGIPIAIGCDMDYPKVNTDDALHSIWCRFFHSTDRKEVELPLDIDQIGLTATCLQELPVPTTAHKWNGLPTVNRLDGHRWCVQVPAHDPVVVGNGTMLSKSTPSTRIHFVGVRYFCDTPDNELCGQREGGADVVVALAVDGKLFERLCIPGRLADNITRFIRYFKRACATRRCAAWA